MAKVRVIVMLKPSLLDSAGRTVLGALHNLGYAEVSQARIGKVVELEVAEDAPLRAREMAERLLANPVIEEFEIEVVG